MEGGLDELCADPSLQKEPDRRKAHDESEADPEDDERGRAGGLAEPPAETGQPLTRADGAPPAPVHQSPSLSLKVTVIPRSAAMSVLTSTRRPRIASKASADLRRRLGDGLAEGPGNRGDCTLDGAELVPNRLGESPLRAGPVEEIDIVVHAGLEGLPDRRDARRHQCERLPGPGGLHLGGPGLTVRRITHRDAEAGAHHHLEQSNHLVGQQADRALDVRPFGVVLPEAPGVVGSLGCPVPVEFRGLRREIRGERGEEGPTRRVGEAVEGGGLPPGREDEVLDRGEPLRRRAEGLDEGAVHLPESVRVRPRRSPPR